MTSSDVFLKNAPNRESPDDQTLKSIADFIRRRPELAKSKVPFKLKVMEKRNGMNGHEKQVSWNILWFLYFFYCIFKYIFRVLWLWNGWKAMVRGKGRCKLFGRRTRKWKCLQKDLGNASKWFIFSFLSCNFCFPPWIKLNWLFEHWMIVKR